MVATELTVVTFPRLFAELGALSVVKGKAALTAVAVVAEAQAKRNASTGSHRYGTPTPARPGTGPAVISGNLRRSITHSEVALNSIGVMEIKVGTGVGFAPPYGHSRTPANKYGYYLETGLRNGASYPFLKPAVLFACGFPAVGIFKTAFGTAWKTSF